MVLGGLLNILWKLNKGKTMPIIGKSYRIKPDARDICVNRWGSDDWSDKYMTPYCGKMVKYLGEYSKTNSLFETGDSSCYFHNDAIEWEEEVVDKNIPRHYPSSI